LRRWNKSWRGEGWGWGAHPWWPPGPGRPSRAPGDGQREQGAVGRSWSREEEGTEERGFRGRKIMVACAYGTARQGRKGRATWPPGSSTQSRVSNSLNVSKKLYIYTLFWKKTYLEIIKNRETF
jgi:hypothetical protein